ncbi:MAG: hypothetical protein IJD12_01050 [Tidjanibacter sp.]|nr:hypothetical protein [Tidjanibacter sp.]
MNKIKNAFYYFLHDRNRLRLAILMRIARFYKSDEKYLKKLFRLSMGKDLNLDNPQTFSEKLQWLKLYNRKPEFTKMVDKYAVKEYVASIIGDEYIIPTLGIWNKFDDIDFDSLPKQFVLKTTHGGGSGGVVVCKDKANFNIEAARKKLNRSLKFDIYTNYREWPYKDVEPRIIAEKYIEVEGHSDLPDYKFFCFNGEPKYCQVIRDRNTKETIDFYDMEWNHMPFVGLNPVANNGNTSVAKPEHLDTMISVCKKLAKDIPFLRIDLYVVNNKEYFGEITFYPASGMGEFRPIEWNYKLGGLIQLPTA